MIELRPVHVDHQRPHFQLGRQAGVLALCGLVDDLRAAELLRARLCRARGDNAGAAAAIERANALLPLHEAPRLARLAGARSAWAQLSLGNIPAAGRWADDYRAWRQREPVETSQDVELLVLGRVALALGEPAQTIDVLHALGLDPPPSGRLDRSGAILIQYSRPRQ